MCHWTGLLCTVRISWEACRQIWPPDIKILIRSPKKELTFLVRFLLPERISLKPKPFKNQAFNGPLKGPPPRVASKKSFLQEPLQGFRV